jgi:hypothetical protein
MVQYMRDVEPVDAGFAHVRGGGAAQVMRAEVERHLAVAQDRGSFLGAGRHTRVTVIRKDVSNWFRVRPVARDAAEELPVGHISIDFAARSVCDLYVTYKSETWSGRLDSNQRPPAPKASPGELSKC